MQKTILVVEDDADLRSFLKKVLDANNFKVAEAADGAAALESVEKYLPDLVLLDFGLPKVPGETVCVKIKKDHPQTLVIALTEKTLSADIVHGLQIGADDYISKPFVAEEVVARIDAAFKTAAAGQVESKETPVSSTQADVSDGKAPETKKLIFRESIVLIIVRLIFAEVIFGLALFLFSMLFFYLSSNINITDLASLYLIVLTGGFLINAVIVIFIALKWNAEYTEVSKDGVVKHSGILNRKEQKYACSFVEAAKLDQSLFGLLFNYGTVELYDPALKEQVYLLNIANPKKCSEVIQSILSNEKNKPMPFVV